MTVKQFHRHNSRNPFGLIGVTLECRKVKNSIIVNWICVYSENGKQIRIAKSIRRYGYEGAYHQVAEIRAKKTGQTMIAKCPPIPEWMKPIVEKIEKRIINK